MLIPVLLAIAVITLLTLLASETKNDGNNQKLQTSLLLCPLSLVAGGVLLLSYRKLAFVELFTPVILIVLLIIVTTINMTQLSGEVTDTMRVQQMNLALFIYTCFALLMGVTWVWGFTMRFLFLVSMTTFVAYLRITNGD